MHGEASPVCFPNSPMHIGCKNNIPAVIWTSCYIVFKCLDFKWACQCWTYFQTNLCAYVLLTQAMCVHVFLYLCAYLCVSGCKLNIPGHGGCNLTGGLTLVNPLLGVLRMMMWAVDPPWWFHFQRVSSRSQIETLWGYYKVKGGLTLHMMTIPSWHFHFLRRPIPHGCSWGQRCLLIFLQISIISAFKREYMLQMCSVDSLCA